MEPNDVKQERSIVERYALRWAVLSAWRDALEPRSAGVDPMLTRARIKIASGCFSACEIGCDLSAVEAQLTSLDASGAEAGVDFWLALLGYSMAEKADAERLLKVPAVRFRFAECRVPGCACVG